MRRLNQQAALRWAFEGVHRRPDVSALRLDWPAMTPNELLAHADSGQPWPGPVDTPAFADRDSAYCAALAMRALRVARGERPCGFKIGFTNRTIWPRYNVFAPIWGTVYDTTLRRCEGQGTLALARTCQPRIEPEAVFGFRKAPPREPDLASLFDAIDWVAPGFEVVQSHRDGWRFTAPETMADNGLHARLLVGATRPVRDLAADADALHATLAAATVTLWRDDDVVDRGHGAFVLDSPLAALLHFVRELHALPGAPDIQPGDVVTTGTWTDAWPVQAGERWTAQFSAPLSALCVQFEATSP
jgi:2-keto-4-pentenoate hydratase